MTRLIKNIKRYAQLLQSVARQDNKNTLPRPLTPVECAQDIQRIIDEEGDTLQILSERLGLGKSREDAGMYKKRDTTQISLFLRLLSVSEKSRSIAGWGYEGFPKISFSLVAQLSKLTTNEQDMILQSAYDANKKKLLVKNDIHQINKWREDNKNLPISECIEKILKLKPVTTINHIVVCEIKNKLKQFIKENKNYEKQLLDIFQKNLNGQFHKIDTTEILITISMDEIAYKTFYEQQYEHNTPFTQFLNDFLENQIG